LDNRRHIQNVKSVVSSLIKREACGEESKLHTSELALMSFCGLKSLAKMFLLFCLVAMMTQRIFSLNLDLNVKGETTSPPNGYIDLYTQKEPYSGKGGNMPSDAFSPQEGAILYALVTYKEVPVQNLLVAFDTKTPANAHFSLTSRTNSNGIASVNFTILTPPISINESEVFGTWVVLANVLIDGVVFQDTLTFEVDWVVKLISVRTMDENLTSRTTFGIGGEVGLEITLRSIAMIMKSATLEIVIRDELNVPVNSSEIRDLKVTSNEKLVFLYCKLYVHKSAFVGKANATVSALTAPVNESGVPYCPAVSTGFFIVPYEPLTINFHDVAVVDATPSAKSFEVGQPVSICAAIQNEGTKIESFNVSAYYENVPIGTLNITALKPYSHVTLDFTLDTTTVEPGNYTIVIHIPHLVNEADITDNVFVDGIIEIKLPKVVHNIAIVDVKISKEILYVGEVLQINVTVINKGTRTEKFDIGTYYDSSLIGTLGVDALAPNAQATLISAWNTSFVREGFYLISASAPLPEDINVADNTFANGIVRVVAKPPPPPIHDVAVLSVSPSKTLVYIGEVITIHVVVKNEGSHVESFDVTVFYESNVVGRLFVNGLQPSSEMPLIFYWNTRNVAEGNYTLSAEANVVPGEINIENNRLVNGIIWVKAWTFPGVWEIPKLLLALLLILAFCLVAAIIFVLLWMCRRKKKSEIDMQPSAPEIKPREVAPFKIRKICKECGREFLGVYTFCPYCLTLHGKDYE
jgi:hypothetical protein